jgi:hypothetical protein
MENRTTSAGLSVTNLGPIEMVREGMAVVDSAGEKVGKVEGLKMGDPESATEAGNELQDTGFLGNVAQALTGDEREPDVPGPAARAPAPKRLHQGRQSRVPVRDRPLRSGGHDRLGQR